MNADNNFSVTLIGFNNGFPSFDFPLYIRLKIIYNEKTIAVVKSDSVRSSNPLLWQQTFSFLKECLQIKDFFTKIVVRNEVSFSISVRGKQKWSKDIKVATPVVLPISTLTLDFTPSETTEHNVVFQVNSVDYTFHFSVEFASFTKRTVLKQHLCHSELRIAKESLLASLKENSDKFLENHKQIKSLLANLSSQRIYDVKVMSCNPHQEPEAVYSSMYTVEQTLYGDGEYHWDVSTALKEVSVTYLFSEPMWVVNIGIQFGILSGERLGGAGKMSIFIGENAVNNFNLAETKELQQFSLYHCSPGTFLKIQFSELSVKTSQYGREIFQFALQKVLFYGICESEAFDMFRTLPYKSFISIETPSPDLILILKCLFKYHFFLQLEESHFVCLLNMFSSEIKFGPKLKVSLLQFIGNLCLQTKHNQIFESLHGIEIILKYAAKSENLTTVASVMLKQYINSSPSLRPLGHELLVTWINKLSTCDYSEYQQKALQLQKELLSDDTRTLNATLIALSSYKFEVVAEAVSSFEAQIQVEKSSRYFLAHDVIGLLLKHKSKEAILKAISAFLQFNPILIPEIISEIFKQSSNFSQRDLETLFCKVGSILQESNETSFQVLLESLQQRIYEGDKLAAFALVGALSENSVVASILERILNKQNQTSLKSLAANQVLDYQAFYPEGYLENALPLDLFQYMYGPSESTSLFCILLIENNPQLVDNQVISLVIDKTLQWMTYEYTPTRKNAQLLLQALVSHSENEMILTQISAAMAISQRKTVVRASNWYS